MSNRKKTILTASLVLILIAIVLAVYFLFLRQSKVTPPEVVATPQDQLESEAEREPGTLELAPEVKQAPPEESEYGQVKNLAVSFAERFGSYSNQANFQNLIELKSQITPSMQTWVDNFIAESRQNNPASTNYYAQTTRALSAQKIRYDAASGQAEFLVKCQRQEYTGSPINPQTYYQDLKITLVKVGDDWKVESAEWQ